MLEQNDESFIPSDLRTSIYALSVKNGGVAEYEKALSIYRDPPTPSHKLSAMAALCATKDQALLKRTFAFIRTDEVKNQDLGELSRALLGSLADLHHSQPPSSAASPRTASRSARCGPSSRRTMTRSCSDSRVRLSFVIALVAEADLSIFIGNFSIGSLVRISFSTLTTAEDVKEIEAFFEKKDTSAYSQPLSQVSAFELGPASLADFAALHRDSTRSSPRPSGSSVMLRVSSASIPRPAFR